MYEKPFSLEIIAPTGIIYQGEVTSVSAPGTLGRFQVLFNHAPLLSSLIPGPIHVRDTAGKDTIFASGGGFLEVRDNKVVVLAESAERPDEIDVERARRAKERAELRLRSAAPDVDEIRAQLALARAKNRLQLAEQK
jgi:F-type H+-transporting ATPase subunit epsilon